MKVVVIQEGEQENGKSGNMPNLQKLAPEGLPSNGPTPLRQMCPRTSMDLPTTASDVRQVCTGGRGKGCAARGLEQQGVTA